MALQVGQAQMAHIMRRGLKDIFGFAALKLIECIGLSSKAELRLSLSQCVFATKSERKKKRRRESGSQLWQATHKFKQLLINQEAILFGV